MDIAPQDAAPPPPVPPLPAEPVPGGTPLVIPEPIEHYLGRTGYWSSSRLRRLARGESPDASWLPYPGPSMGEALHAFLLEPERFAQEYFRPRAVAQGAVMEGTTPPEERIWMDAKQGEALDWALAAVQRYARAPLARWLATGTKEYSIYWASEDGLRWKARPDCFTEEIVLDVKSVGDARPNRFARLRRQRGYDVQAALYVEAVERVTGRRPRFAYLSIELIHPRALWLHELSDEDLAAARAQIEALRPLLGLDGRPLATAPSEVAAQAPGKDGTA